MEYATIGVAAALGSAASWAIGAILLKKIGDSLSSLAMTLVKGMISIVFLGIGVLIIGYTPMTFATLALLVVSGLLGIAISDSCFFEALKDLGPVALVVLMMLGQIVTVVLAVVFLGERPPLLAWVAIGMILAGVVVVISGNVGSGRHANGIRGILFGVGSVLSMSVSLIMAKIALVDTDSMQATLVRMLAGTIGVFIFGAMTRRVGAWVNPFMDAKVALRFAGTILIVTFGGFWLTMVAFKRTDVVVANTLINTEPLFVLPLAYIILKEKITGRGIIGTLLAVTGIVILLGHVKP